MNILLIHSIYIVGEQKNFNFKSIYILIVMTTIKNI